MKITFNNFKNLLFESITSVYDAYEDILCDIFDVDDISKITPKAYQQILDDYENNMLNEHDSSMLESAEKLVWKAANKAGYNIIAHHGSTKKFSEFKYGDIGFHLGTLEQAKIAGKAHISYGSVNDIIFYNIALRLHNPLVIKDDLGNWYPAEIVEGATEYLWFNTKIKSKIEKTFKRKFSIYNGKVKEILDNNKVLEFIETYIKNLNIKRNPGQSNDLAQFCFLYYDLNLTCRDIFELWNLDDFKPNSNQTLKQFILTKIKSLGYDGIKYLNLYEVDHDSNKLDYSYIVLDANQIKNCEVISFKDGKIVPLDERFNSGTNNLYEGN